MKFEIMIEWMDGEIRTIENVGQYGPGVVQNGCLLCYTKENRMAEAKLTEIIPLTDIRQISVKEVYW